MEKRKTEFMGVTIPKGFKDKAQEMSVEIFGRVNLSGFIAYLIHKEIKNRSKNASV